MKESFVLEKKEYLNYALYVNQSIILQKLLLYPFIGVILSLIAFQFAVDKNVNRLGLLWQSLPIALLIGLIIFISVRVFIKVKFIPKLQDQYNKTPELHEEQVLSIEETGLSLKRNGSFVHFFGKKYSPYNIITH